MYTILIIMGIVVLLISAYLIYKYFEEKRDYEERLRRIVNQGYLFTPSEFFEYKFDLTRRFNIPGVYILYNISKDMHYIGQGKKVFNRVQNHFSGRGNGDVYADYKYGDQFEIKIIPLQSSGFYTLNELERNLIFSYGSYKRGYNKTRGNLT